MSEITNVLDPSDPSRFSIDTLSHRESRILTSRLGRMQHVGEKAEGIMIVRSFIQRLQIAASEMTGCIFSEMRVMEAEFQGAVFRFCHFKKVKFEAASFREVRFESCTFEDCSINPSMEIADIDNVKFENCFIYDAEENFSGLLVSNAWTFNRCVIASPAIFESPGNTLLALLAFIPGATVDAAPVRHVTPEPPNAIQSQPAPKTAQKEAPKTKPNRFDQLELG